MNIQKSYSDLVFRRTSIEILQCFLVFADAQLTKIPTPTRCKEFCHMVMRRICKLESDGSLWQFLPQSKLSYSIERYNEPSRLHRNFANRILWFKSTRRMPGEEVRGTPLKKWLERNVVWQSRYLIRAKVNIFMLHCALVIRTFRTEGI